MRCYQEITLLPNPEVNIHFLWSKVFQQIHLGLVEMQDAEKRVPIGVGFPDYKIGEKYGVLGSKCRLFAADEATLVRFDAGKWLSRLSDYVHCTSIRPVPATLAGHAIYRRLQPKTNKERLARRYAKRHPLSYDEALQHYSGIAPASIPTPFIRLTSLSSGEQFCLWIDKILVTEASKADFSSYGLSPKATIPEF
ncbi:type I-F CRISPR-associated endoribonuclease Cas6/Csy4 [Methylomonas sp. LL1]|uniref:type I-F CRISPR-associated endoribonuclease Cas6/Csy4 n=1 Tax=Methylomonas sp. LL1 TaxID=2785785 RepID=UPI0018C3C1DF|nr:type I-F CRISPR-associated endoribonuclease Cas6/Csy4 [Methylomonas sp. LL1]QPK65106.1 type I-F CRISPR-associated endoribonuclease Cas6/Csy4 [Methylomonas sp. LL1]